MCSHAAQINRVAWSLGLRSRGCALVGIAPDVGSAAFPIRAELRGLAAVATGAAMISVAADVDTCVGVCAVDLALLAVVWSKLPVASVPGRDAIRK